MEQKRRIIPPVYFLLALFAMGALHILLPLARIIEPPLAYSGGLLVVLGIAISLVASHSFAKVGTPVVPFERSTSLVESGLFRYTRNPMYLGIVMALVGGAVLLGTASPWLPVVIFVWIIHTQFIVGEERFLEGIFGERYLAYKRRVRRWL